MLSGLLLVALILRGVASELRYKIRRARWLWDFGFAAGSTVASFVQGAAIGANVRGIAVDGRAFAGGPFDSLRPFPLLCGLGLVVGYALLGAARLVLNTEGALRDWAYRWLPRLMTGVIVFVVLALAATLIADYRVVDRWLGEPWLFALQVIASLAALILYRAAATRNPDWEPYAMASLLFLTAYLMLAGSFWPWIVPYHLTLADAGATQSSLTFLFRGADVVVLPVILIYTGVFNWVFRGKLAPNQTYH